LVRASHLARIFRQIASGLRPLAMTIKMSHCEGRTLRHVQAKRRSKPLSLVIAKDGRRRQAVFHGHCEQVEDLRGNLPEPLDESDPLWSGARALPPNLQSGTDLPPDCFGLAAAAMTIKMSHCEGRTLRRAQTKRQGLSGL
jgi:hypothetical protein